MNAQPNQVSIKKSSVFLTKLAWFASKRWGFRLVFHFFFAEHSPLDFGSVDLHALALACSICVFSLSFAFPISLVACNAINLFERECGQSGCGSVSFDWASLQYASNSVCGSSRLITDSQVRYHMRRMCVRIWSLRCTVSRKQELERAPNGPLHFTLTGGFSARCVVIGNTHPSLVIVVFGECSCVGPVNCSVFGCVFPSSSTITFQPKGSPSPRHSSVQSVFHGIPSRQITINPVRLVHRHYRFGG